MKKTFKLAFMCLVVSLSIVSCSDDEKSAGSTLTPDENKAKLDEIGVNLVSKINADDHEQLVLVTNEFAKLAEEGELDIHVKEKAKAMIQSVNGICTKANLGGMAEYAAADADVYSASDYYGIYTYNATKNEWTYTSSTSVLEFRFPMNNKNAVISATSSVKTTEIEIEEDYTYVNIPESASLKITLGSDELCKLQVNNSLTSDSYAGKLTAVLSASGYEYNMAVDAASKKIAATLVLKKNGESLISSVVNVVGEGMTEFIEETENEEDEENLEERFQNARVEATILNDLNFLVYCSDIKSYVQDMNELNDGNDDSYSKKYAEAEAAIMNKYLTGEMRYAGSSDLIAKIQFKAYEAYNWGSYSEWEIEPLIVFTIDNSPYSFAEYFDEVNFKDLIDSVKDLADAYDSFLN